MSHKYKYISIIYIYILLVLKKKKEQKSTLPPNLTNKSWKTVLLLKGPPVRIGGRVYTYIYMYIYIYIYVGVSCFRGPPKMVVFLRVGFNTIQHISGGFPLNIAGNHEKKLDFAMFKSERQSTPE